MGIESIRSPFPPLPQAEGAASERARASSEAGPSAEAPEARSLWEMLTPAERDFFARVETLGPLTYKPGAARAPRASDGAVPTGQRIDVKG